MLPHLRLDLPNCLSLPCCLLLVLPASVLLLDDGRPSVYNDTQHQDVIRLQINKLERAVALQMPLRLRTICSE
jgi:hypothetical protein